MRCKRPCEGNSSRGRKDFLLLIYNKEYIKPIYTAERRNMEVNTMMLRAKPFRGKWCSRRTANRINDLLNSAPKLNKAALEEEVKTFEEYAKTHKLFYVSK